MAENSKIETPVNPLDASVPQCDFCYRFLSELTDDPSTDDGHWIIGTGKYVEADQVYCCHKCLPEIYGSAAT